MTKNPQEALSKIELIVRHIENVKDNCLILGKKLIEKGEIELGVKLIANSYLHDNSKFGGIEFEFLEPGEGKNKLDLAIYNHNTTNPHHPEYFGSIHKMPLIFLSEMLCDWKARAEEFGTSIHEWVEKGAAKRFGYTKRDKVYKHIKYFLDLLCDKPFKQNE